VTEPVSGKAIEDYMSNIRKATGGNEPEVLLGVRLPGHSTMAENEINDEDIDSMLMTHGFEYIDASQPLPDKNSRDDEGDRELFISPVNCSTVLTTPRRSQPPKGLGRSKCLHVAFDDISCSR
jgi:hypothetical protein